MAQKVIEGHVSHAFDFDIAQLQNGSKPRCFVSEMAHIRYYRNRISGLEFFGYLRNSGPLGFKPLP